MADIGSLLSNLAGSIWEMLFDSAFLLLVGIFLAGLIHLFLSDRTLQRLLKGGKTSVIFKSAIVGVPLPLCSCSVLPVAHQLRQSGLSRGGTAAFLISTPETGVDSILLTYSLTDPLLTVARPVAGFLTAMAAGLSVEMAPERIESTDASVAEKCHDCAVKENKNAQMPLFRRLAASLRYAFVDMLGDLSPYLFMGYVLAGIVALILGGDITAIPDGLKSGWAGYVGAIVVGLPLYICATSSTPLAAVLLAAGFSPGAILVFLLVGPATNIASLTVVKKILGGASLARYLAAIILVAVACGIVVDFLYTQFDIQEHYLTGDIPVKWYWVNTVSAIVFAVYITYLVAVRAIKRLS